MAKAPVRAKSAPEPVYDVAISFLAADEKTASAIKTRLAGLNVFFYPHNQEELIGTNGLESMRAPAANIAEITVPTPFQSSECIKSASVQLTTPAYGPSQPQY
jgi:hypothetical protein